MPQKYYALLYKNNQNLELVLIAEIFISERGTEIAAFSPTDEKASGPPNGIVKIYYS